MDFYAPAPDPVYELERRAIKVLNLIVAEFTSDPMSVQCFDLRTVAEAKEIIASFRQMERSGKIPPLLTDGAEGHMKERLLRSRGSS